MDHIERMAVIEPFLVELPLIRNVEVSFSERLSREKDILIEVFTVRLQFHVAR
jgi:hypothetical protein